MEIEVNGINYEYNEPPKESKNFSKLMTLSVMFGGMMYGVGGSVKKLLEPSAWLIEEFKLIQNKQSKLSRSERDLVEASFHKHFKKVNQTT